MANISIKENNMIISNIKQQFIHFLKDNNAYEQYMLNFNNRNKMSRHYSKKSFIRYFKITEEILLINNAFDWQYSPENFSFWENLNVKWIIYLHK